MKKIINYGLCAVMFGLMGASAALAAGLDDLRGGWAEVRTNENNEVYTQTLDFEKDKFIFKIVDANKKTVLFAKGDVKVETRNSLNIISFTHIEAGESSSDLSPEEDDRNCIYFLDDDKLSIAIDFDKNRQKTPRVEVYTKAKK